MIKSDDDGSSRPTKPKLEFDIPGINSIANLPVPAGKPAQTLPFGAFVELDRRIASAPVNEIYTLVQVRGELGVQDERRRDGEHRRRGQMSAFYSRICFSIAAAIGGSALIVAEFVLPGFFLLGGAAAVHVPEYVKHAINRLKSGDGDAH